MIGDLAQLIWAAPLAALVVTISFSLCVMGATRASDARRGGSSGVLWVVLAVVSGLAVAAEVAAGLAVIVAG